MSHQTIPSEFISELENLELTGQFSNVIDKTIGITPTLSNATSSSLNTSKCPECKSGIIRIRNGRYGPFRGCSNYPNCKYTMDAPA